MIQLINRALQSDKEAFLELMNQNSCSMYKIAWAVLKNTDDAADAVQDTILTCYEKLHTLRRPEYFKSWMIRILLNHCYRIQRHYQHLDMEQEISEVPAADLSLAEFEFKELLQGLDEKYRIILILYYAEELRISEIASILDLNENTVKTRLKRAREQLKIQLNET